MKSSPTFWTWEHQLEVLCRVDPAYSSGPLAPALDTDTDWTTFMQPTATGSPLEAIKDGFAPPAMAAALRDSSKVGENALPPIAWLCSPPPAWCCLLNSFYGIAG